MKEGEVGRGAQWGIRAPRTNQIEKHSVFLFEIKRVLVYNSTILKITDLYILYFFIQIVYANKKLFQKKGYKIMCKGSNCDQKSEILTEPLNPREGRSHQYLV